MTKFLVSQGADLQVKDRSGWTALHHAAALCTQGRGRSPVNCDVGGGKIVEFLLSQGMDLRGVNNYGYTPLHIACSALDLSAVQVLLAKGARVDVRAIDGDMPIHTLDNRPEGLHTGRFGGNQNTEVPRILDLLVEHGADISAPGKGGHTALHRAVKLVSPASVAGWLLDRNADVDAQDHYGNTPLLHAYSQRNAAEYIEVLIDRGADLQKHMQRHQHELDCALDRCDLALAGILLDHGVSTERNPERAKAVSLHEAARDAPKLLKYLLDQGQVDIAGVDSRGYTALGAAIDEQNAESARILLNHGATCEVVGPCPCGKKEHTATALRVAADNGNIEILRLLLNAGALPNARNSNNNTALTYAAECGQAECLKILLEISNIDINAVDDDGDSALLCAVHGGRANTTKILLARPDVDRSIRNKLGLTAEDLARRDKKIRIIRLFEKGVQDQDEDDSDSSSSLIELVGRPRTRHSPRVRVYPRVYPRPRARYAPSWSSSDD